VSGEDIPSAGNSGKLFGTLALCPEPSWRSSQHSLDPVAGGERLAAFGLVFRPFGPHLAAFPNTVFISPMLRDLDKTPSMVYQML